MKLLKALGWMIVPYIMLPFQWKKISTVGKTLGMVWVVIVLLVGLGNANNNNQKPIAEPAAKTISNAPIPETKPVDAPKPQTTSTPAPVPASSKSSNSTPSSIKQPEIPGTIGMTPEQFRKIFNDSAKKAGSNLAIKKLNISEGELQNSFQYMFSDQMGIMGTINKKDGSVRDVMILGQPKDTTGSFDLILGMGVLIKTTNPELSADERGKVLKDLGLLSKDVDITNLNNSTIRNGIKYSINTSTQFGIMFSAGDANDKS